MTEPGYWMHETTGAARAAVVAYFHGEMTPDQIAAMRAYLRQWIDAPVWERNPHVDRAMLKGMRHWIDDLDSIEAIRAWIVEASDAGMDPL